MENMAESSNKHLSHKCCAAALCSNRSVKRKDLIFHAFPKDEILGKTWEITMKRGDKKFASKTVLYCCSEHFVETDYRKSYNALIAFWNFVKPCSESLLSWNKAHAKVNGNLADSAFP